jgi:type I restriction enzyme S subunit
VLDDIVRISHAGHADHAKSVLHPGDVAVVRTGRPGDAAVIPPDVGPLNCIDLIIMRPKESLNPHYLCLFLNASAGRALFASGATGTAQQHFNVGACKGVRLPIPPRAEQDCIVDTVLSMGSALDAVIVRHTQANRLLRSTLGRN